MKEMKNTRHFIRTITLFLAIAMLPMDASGKTIHIILSVHDVGEPHLYAFRRLIVNVE